jgi:hypothetical protein
MAENPRIAWLIAFDADSPRLRCDDFVQLSVKECKTTLVDATRVLVRLRLEKRVRSNQVVEELRRMQDDGRIRSAWIERRPTANEDDFDSMVQADGTSIDLERILDEETAAGKSKKKPMMTKKRLVHSTPPISNEQCEDEDGEEIQYEEDDEDDEEEGTDDRIKTLIKSCMQDIQKRMLQLEHQLRSHKRTKKHQNPPIKPPGIPYNRPIKPPGIPYNRPPLKLSFLRTASVSELYYSGVWVPEFDVDPTAGRLKRECRFRSELPADQYVEGYDMDDETYEAMKHPDTVLWKNRADALKRTFYMHFVDRPPLGRLPITLDALRTSNVDVLLHLKILFLDYDTDDETAVPDPKPNRPRMVRTEMAIKGGLNPNWSTDGFYLVGPAFIRGYDMDDVAAEEAGKIIQGHASAFRKELQDERKT